MDSFKRDEQSGALLNTSTKELSMLQARRAEARKNKDLVKRVEALENEMRELKAKLSQGT